LCRDEEWGGVRRNSPLLLKRKGLCIFSALSCVIFVLRKLLSMRETTLVSTGTTPHERVRPPLPNHRNTDQGEVCAQVVYSFGPKDRLEAETIEPTSRSLCRLIAPEEGPPGKVAQKDQCMIHRIHLWMRVDDDSPLSVSWRAVLSGEAALR